MSRKSRSLEVEYDAVEAIFFFLSDEEDFPFSSHLFVLPPCRLLPSLKLTSMWIIGAFPVDSAVIQPFQHNESSHILRHSCLFLAVAGQA